MKKIIQVETVEIIVTGGSTATKYSFPDLPHLNNAKLMSIECYSAMDITKSIYSGNVLVPETLLKASYLTLQNYAGVQFAEKYPMVSIHKMRVPTALSSDSLFDNTFCGQITNWSKCIVEVSDTSLIPGTDSSYLFSIYYYDESKQVLDNQQNVFSMS